MKVIPNCPACCNYDVFGLPREYCCYLFHDMCYNIENCTIKRVLATGHKDIEDILQPKEVKFYE